MVVFCGRRRELAEPLLWPPRGLGSGTQDDCDAEVANLIKHRKSNFVGTIHVYRLAPFRAWHADPQWTLLANRVLANRDERVFILWEWVVCSH